MFLKVVVSLLKNLMCKMNIVNMQTKGHKILFIQELLATVAVEFLYTANNSLQIQYKNLHFKIKPTFKKSS